MINILNEKVLQKIWQYFMTKYVLHQKVVNTQQQQNNKANLLQHDNNLNPYPILSNTQIKTRQSFTMEYLVVF